MTSWLVTNGRGMYVRGWQRLRGRSGRTYQSPLFTAERNEAMRYANRASAEWVVRYLNAPSGCRPRPNQTKYRTERED